FCSSSGAPAGCASTAVARLCVFATRSLRNGCAFSHAEQLARANMISVWSELEYHALGTSTFWPTTYTGAAGAALTPKYEETRGHRTYPAVATTIRTSTAIPAV